MLKPADDTKVGCHANTKSKTLSTEPSDDEIFETLATFATLAKIGKNVIDFFAWYANKFSDRRQ